MSLNNPLQITLNIKYTMVNVLFKINILNFIYQQVYDSIHTCYYYKMNFYT